MNPEVSVITRPRQSEAEAVPAGGGFGPYPCKFRLAHIITQLELGGAQQNTLHTIRTHDRSKFEVSLITNKLGILNAEAEAIPDTEVHYLQGMKREIDPIRDIPLMFELAALLRRLKIDIVHTHSSKAGIAGRLAARLAGVPVVVHTVHGWPFHGYLSRRRNFLYSLFERPCAALSDRILTVSARDIEKGLSAGVGARGKYTVVRSGIDCAKFFMAPLEYDERKTREEIKVPEDAFLVCQINSFKPGKNNLALLDIADMLLKTVPNAYFLLLGDGVQREEMEKETARRGLAGRFRFLGWRRDVEKFIPASDVVTLTTLHEGLPQVCAQAMCCGKPMVMHAVDGIPEACIEGETGFLVEPGDTAGFADRLALLASSPEMRERMGERGRLVAYPEWDADLMVRRIESVYHEILVEKGMVPAAAKVAPGLY